MDPVSRAKKKSITHKCIIHRSLLINGLNCYRLDISSHNVNESYGPLFLCTELIAMSLQSNCFPLRLVMGLSDAFVEIGHVLVVTGVANNISFWGVSIINNNHKRDLYSAHFLHRIGAQITLQ